MRDDEPALDDARLDAEADTAFYRAALHEIIGLASDLARRIHAAAATPEPALTLDQASIALDRTARILRRTVLLARRLHQPAPARTAARQQVIRGVEDAIHRAARDRSDHQAALGAELQERLDRPEFEADLATRPIPELIEELARDLGVAVQGRSWVFPRRTPADIDNLLARALRKPAPPANHAQPPPPPPPIRRDG